MTDILLSSCMRTEALEPPPKVKIESVPWRERFPFLARALSGTGHHYLCEPLAVAALTPYWFQSKLLGKRPAFVLKKSSAPSPFNLLEPSSTPRLLNQLKLHLAAYSPMKSL